MLKEIIVPITEQYHNLGHIRPVVDKMMDSASGRGHRLAYGHDTQSMIEAYHLDGIEGIGGWFDHMAKDFTSPDGIPLPFAEAIKEFAGINTTDAIDWLCINAADAIELGGQAAVIQLFKNNPSMYKAAVIIGTMIGIVDDNPLLIAYNAVLVLKGLKNTGRLNLLFDSAGTAMERCFSIVSIAAMGVALTNISLALAGLNLSEIVDDAFSVLELIEGASEITDIIDGLTTFGIGIIAARGVKYLFSMLNKEKMDKLKSSQSELLWRKTLRTNLVYNSSPTKIAAVLELADKNGAYKPMLWG